MTSSTPLELEYRRRYNEVLAPMAGRLHEYLSASVRDVPRIDRIATRAKSINRFLDKANKKTASGEPKYDDPLSQIQDQIGARIIALYLSDVEAIAGAITKYLRPIEQRDVSPESDREFGYTGKHFILFLPSDIFDDSITRNMAPTFFELQIKTLFQHAWSEAEHDLGYKPESPLSSDQKRRIAFTAAQAWGADHHFNELHTETTHRRGKIEIVR